MLNPRTEAHLLGAQPGSSNSKRYNACGLSVLCLSADYPSIHHHFRFAHRWTWLHDQRPFHIHWFTYSKVFRLASGLFVHKVQTNAVLLLFHFRQ